MASDSAKILVVDDEADLELLIRQKFRKQIRANELDFAFARNGEEALQIIQQNEIDMVLTDINMPVMDGLTFLLRLGEMDRLLKAVVVSAYGDMDNIRKAMNRGAFDFLTKPINFEDLDLTIEKTIRQVDTLKEAANTQKQLQGIRQELDIAKRIQDSILPSVFPAFPERTEFDLFAAMTTAKEVGGDFYDFFLIDPSHLGLVIADVSDKGIGAAMFMAVSRTLMRATALMGFSPEECLAKVNDLLARENSNAMFVTLFYAILDTRTGEIAYCDGGHNPPFILRKSGKAEMIKKVGNMALGWFEEAPYEPGKLKLEAGDSLFLYTDGVTEAMNFHHQLFSEARLGETLEAQSGSLPEALVQGTFEAVQRHADGAPQSDDITILALRYHGV